MSTVDASIPLSVQQYQAPDQLGIATKAYQLKEAIQSGRDADQARQERGQLKDLFAQGGYGTPEFAQKLGSIAPEQLPAYEKNLLDTKVAESKISETHALEKQHSYDLAKAKINDMLEANDSTYSVYQENLKKFGPQQALQIAEVDHQKQMMLATNEKDANGNPLYSPEEIAKFKTSHFDPRASEQAHLKLLGAKGMMEQQNKDREFDLKKSEAGETARHHKAVESRMVDPDAKLSPEDIKALAKQGRAGDTTVFQNLGRGRQGAENIVAIRSEMRRQNEEEGTSPEEQAAKNAEFMGFKSGQRALGTREANIELAGTEARGLSNLALKASEEWNRTGIKSLNDLEKFAQGKTASPTLRRFVAANTSFINAYARAINPQGVGTVADKEHAREMLEIGFAKGDYAAAIDQLQSEIGIAQEAPGTVKQSMRDRFTGKEPAKSDKGKKPTSNAKGWVLHVDDSGNEAYVSPDGKQFEEAD